MEEMIRRDEQNLVLHDSHRLKRALLISTYERSSEKPSCEEHLDELELLGETFGIQTIKKIPCTMRKVDASTFLGKGKIEELLEIIQTEDIDMVVFDDEITPAQQRNLEKFFGKTVMDRTEVILGVFAQRAQTKEARLQIELAKVKYEAPRLKRLWTHLSRQQGTSGAGGGGAYLKGEGEKQIEIDRRILKRKIEALQEELEQVKASRDILRQVRVKSEIPVFAIVGYTNAGKSTLLNALTGSDVFVEDKLFATLDTTTRKFHLPNNQDILLIDTVGFIRKLPHLLVAAFKSTLEEAVEADVLIHLVDASHPMAEEQVAATQEVLKELGAKNKTILTVFNKIDKHPDPARLIRLRALCPKNVLVSAVTREGFDELQEKIIEELSRQRRTIEVRVPQKDYHIVSELIRLGNVLNQEYEENDILLKVEVPAMIAGKLLPYQIK